jgi:hypothetical protein
LFINLSEANGQLSAQKLPCNQALPLGGHQNIQRAKFITENGTVNKRQKVYVKLEVLMAVIMKIIIMWYVPPYSLLHVLF